MSPKRLIERFYHEVWNRADEVVAREILHPEFCFRGSLGEEKRGPDGFITYLRMIHAALSKYTCTIEEIVEEGQRVAARMRFAGIHRGRLFGVAPLRPGDFMVRRRFFCNRWRQDYQALGTWRH